MDLSQLEKLLAFKQSEEIGEKLKPSQRALNSPGEVFTDNTMHSALLAQVIGLAGNQNAISEINKTLANLSVEIQEASRRGDLGILEQLLITQSVTLSNIGAHFMVKALALLEDGTILKRLPHLIDQLINASLRCSGESRKCIALLNEIKNPKRKSIFIKQQLNQLNLTEDQLQQLEGGDYEQISAVDTGAQREAIPVDSPVGTVEEIDRAKNRTGKEKSIPKRQGTRAKKSRSRRDAAAD
ncbi:hypothetical protein NIES4106_61500 (plasmid) [Fischerella sp. NIES-4106]|nr:hypothetical protein NIES4106_61500 [Fischerella sp. NIES-4106]